MSHLLITYFEDLNPSLCNIKYLCDKITQGDFDCGNNSYENEKFKTKQEICSHRDLITNQIKGHFSQFKDLEKKSDNIKSLSEMLNAANKAKKMVNSLRKLF
ncbi:uncharacterized protein cubi_00224 [Cryptosporidium ubiquitum]|uniref:Uncharacterized protein n=1 Tax=Cryptosporidium ubiquitum TaxID=857276 RepID=A0A1J4MKW1_9CRYT|nr:uncharacterized protein cubi_00224 [Cryptosporidium ubiquitum]OII74671.1 hypothetical protein cubi_00224 [Cryptosporidium ubiquitum]